MRSLSRMLTLSIAALPLIGIAAGAVTLPEIPKAGESGQTIALPDVVDEHRPTEAGPSDVGAPSFAFGTIPEGVPPEPTTPAGPGEHPLGMAPPFNLGDVPGEFRKGPSGGPVPEPGTGILFLAGIAGLAAMGRRREN